MDLTSNPFQDILGRVTPSEPITGTAGGGVVTVTLEGARRLTSVKLTPEAFSDREMLEDLIVAAVNDALQQASEQTKTTASRLLEQLTGVPGGALPPTGEDPS